MVLILFSSDCLCVFGLLSFFPVPDTVCLYVLFLKRLITLSSKPPTILLIGSGI